jgi:Na+/H+ antiporter NhaA
VLAAAGLLTGMGFTGGVFIAGLVYIPITLDAVWAVADRLILVGLTLKPVLPK